MRFGRIRDDLDQLRDSGKVTADEILSLFFDLCEDVHEEMGTTVDKLPVNSVDSLMKRLPWTGNTVRRIYKANAEEVLSPERQRLLQDVDERVREAVEEAEKAAGELEKTKEKRDRLRANQERLRSTLQEQERTEAENRTLTAQIGELEKRFKPDLVSQRDALRNRKAALTEETRQLTDEVRKEKEMVAVQQEQARGLADRKAQLLKEISDRKTALEEMTRTKVSLEEQSRLADSGVRQLQEKINELKSYMENRDYGALKKRQLEDLDALQKARESYNRLEAEYRETKKTLGETLIHNEKALKEAQAEQKSLQEKIAGLADRQSALAEENTMLRAKHEASMTILKKQQEEQARQADQRKFAILQKEQEISQEADRLLREEKDLETQLTKLREERTAGRIEEAKRRTALMRQVKEELDSHYEQLLLSLGKTPEQVKASELFEAKLYLTEKDIRECAALYRKVLRALEDK